MKQILILGAGISGLSAGYHLAKKGFAPVILEKEARYGGLCGNFTIEGFRFDRFVHFSFTDDPYVKELFAGSSPAIAHTPDAYNYYRGKWIKHPAQNNLYPLDAAEKKIIITDFMRRPEMGHSQPDDYETWLRMQYGDYFAEHFPMAYTRKYWMCEARELETRWIGSRLYRPSVDEVIRGSREGETPVTYYAKEMRYPATGGFRAFLEVWARTLDVRCGEAVTAIDLKTKTVTTATGRRYGYKTLISTLPLPELIGLAGDVPAYVRAAAGRLKCTSGYQVSVGLKTRQIPPYLWWYIYDEDFLPARVYSPSLKSPDNAPDGCASLQMEIYCRENQYSRDELYARSVGKLIAAGVIRPEDVLFTDIRFEKYANVVFDRHIYESRSVVKSWCESQGIRLAGRFGEWDYLWSDQSLESGKNVAEHEI